MHRVHDVDPALLVLDHHVVARDADEFSVRRRELTAIRCSNQKWTRPDKLLSNRV